MQPSPYTPGEIAREVPGRQTTLADIDERLSYVLDLRRLAGRIRVDHGVRGVGKTSLLRAVQSRAGARGALTVWVTCGGDVPLLVQMAEAIDRQTTSWPARARGAVGTTLTQLSLSAGIGVPGVAHADVSWTAGPRAKRAEVPVPVFRDLIRSTARGAIGQDSRGLVILLDEVQAADPSSLRVLATAWQEFGAEEPELAAAVFAAGLPNTQEVISAAVTFSERFAYRPLGLLSDDAARLALIEPARRLGVRWRDEALEGAVRAAGGYPYTLQLYGDAAWTAAGRPDPGGLIDAVALGDAGRLVAADLDALFRARWATASSAEQHLMETMAALGDGSVRRGEIATRLGISTTDLSTPRQRLLDKGLIEASGHGMLSFTIPGFAAFVRRHSGQE